MNKKGLLFCHIATLLFGISGLFGKLLSLPALIITLGRVVFASIALFFILLLFKQPVRLNQKRHYGYFLLLGLLLAVHWACFYQAIQLSTVAMGLLSFSTYPVFITFLEPLFFKRKLRMFDTAIAGLVFLGILLVVPSFTAGDEMTKGILVGVLSGFTYAFLCIFNKKLTADYSGMKVAFYEQFFACFFLLPFLFLYRPVFTGQDLLLLALLGVLFTGVAHTLFITGMKRITAQTAGIISCLEPLYSALLAFLLLKETPGIKTIVGGVIILGAVGLSTLKGSKMKIEIRKIESDKKSYAALLLDADPSWEMIEKYIDQDMYVLFVNGEAAAEMIVSKQGDMPEIKNIATALAFRRQGLAKKLVLFAFEQYASVCGKICVGTCTVSGGARAFYESCGFSYSHTVENFFQDNYQEPIYEEGCLCKDMVYFVADVK